MKMSATTTTICWSLDRKALALLRNNLVVKRRQGCCGSPAASLRQGAPSSGSAHASAAYHPASEATPFFPLYVTAQALNA